MDFVINFIGFANCTWILMNRANRKYFCVCDKITIGDKMPQCTFGAFAHLFSLLLILLSLGAYCFYPLSIWAFALLYSSIYTYKGFKELCKGCILAFTCSTFAVVLSYYQLTYFPWIILCIYSSLLILSLCLTSMSMDKSE